MVPWREASGEILLTEAQLIALEPGGAYAVGRNPEGNIQANDLVRGGLAWKKGGREFAVHTSAGRVAIRQESGSVRFFDAATGRLLFEQEPEDADLTFREEGSTIPVLFALAAGMLPTGQGQYAGEARMSRGFVAACLRTGELVLAEQATGREVLRVLPFASGNSLCAAPDGAWGGSAVLRPVVEGSFAGSRGLIAWDAGLCARVLGDPGPTPPGVAVMTGPWKIVTREARQGEIREREWSYWLQENGKGRISGRGNLVGLDGLWANGRDRGTWSGLQLRLERAEARGESEERADGEVQRRAAWQVRFAEDGLSFRGVQRRAGEMSSIEVEGSYAPAVE